MGHCHVLFYALLFVSSCRPKRNYPVAEKERYFENCYNQKRLIDFTAMEYKIQMHSIGHAGELRFHRHPEIP
jgi:hypothetical protein